MREKEQHISTPGRGRIQSVSMPLVMGIINVTPDSFYGESRNKNIERALSISDKHIAEGASILDIGAQSTRPEADLLTAEQEIERLAEILPLLRKRFPHAILSVDTFYGKTVDFAVDCGIDWINDISGGSIDSAMLPAVAAAKRPYVLMHMRGTPQNMQEQTDYKDVFVEVKSYFSQKTRELNRMGIQEIIYDPGFGFAKTAEQSFSLLRQLHELFDDKTLVLAGFSRKSMIYKTLNSTAEEALNGTTALNMFSLCSGVRILRVHDVKEAMECVKLYESIYADKK